MLSSSALRQIWSVIEQTNTPILLESSDPELIKKVQEQLERQRLLNASEITAAYNYISSKIPLIRDIAESRLAKV